jgi:hypothetical protein
MKKLLFSCLFLLVTATIFAQNKTEDMILKLDRQRFDAQINKDIKLLNELLSDDLVYVHSSAVVESKKEFVDNISNKKWDYREVNIEKVKARLYGKNTAIINGTAKINLWQTDKMVTVYLHYLDVWAKEKGKWRIVSWQSTRISQ